MAISKHPLQWIIAVLVVIGLLGLAAGSTRAHAAPAQAHHPVQASQAVSHQVQASCGFSQILNAVPIYTNSDGQIWLYPCDGLYVNCWSTGGSYNGDSWYEWVSWTSPYGYRYQGWVPDWGIQTYGYPPSMYWPQC